MVGNLILGHGTRFRRDYPRFGDFQYNWVPILYLNTIRLTPSFCKKTIGLSLSHLGLETPGLKFDMFHQNVLFKNFKHLYQFSP